MGCCCSDPVFENVYIQHQKEYTLLGLTKSDVRHLYKMFCKVDKDRSGQISQFEFLMFLDLDRSFFVDRTFAIMDEDGNDEIEFFEVVTSLWNYCTLDRSALLLFAFDVFDKDNGGLIDADEMHDVLVQIYGTRRKKLKMARDIKAEIERISKSRGGMTQGMFVEFARKHKSILTPVFDLQRRLRSKCGGDSFWNKHTRNRNYNGLAAVGRPDALKKRVAAAAQADEDKRSGRRGKKGVVSPAARAQAEDADANYLSLARRNSLGKSGDDMKGVAGSLAERRAAHQRMGHK